MTAITHTPESASPGELLSKGSGRGTHPLTPTGQAVARCVARLQRLYMQDNSAAVATLARLRRGAGKPAHDDPDHWGADGLEDLAEILDEAAAARAAGVVGGQAPLSDRDRGRAEEAVHLTVTLWALHQQSVRDVKMYAHDWRLGRAVRFLAQQKSGDEAPATGAAAGESGSPAKRTATGGGDGPNEALRKRFVRIGTSTSLDALAVRLREMVLLLREARIPLDYARLADQLYNWQNERLRAEVRRAWGREFHLAFGQDTRGTPGQKTGSDRPSGLPDAGDPADGLDDDMGSGE